MARSLAVRESGAADPEAIRAFCEICFGYLEGFACVRLIPEGTNTLKKPRQSFLALNELADGLIAAAADGNQNKQAVFVTPGAYTQSRQAGNDYVTAFGALVVDLDAGDVEAARMHLEAGLGPASLIVASGGRTETGADRLHMYWRLTEAAVGHDLTTANRLRLELAVKVGADPCFKSLQQPIRLPGSIHWKSGTSRQVRVIEHRKVEYHLSDLAESIRDLPSLSGAARAANGGGVTANPRVSDLMMQPVRENAQDGITRFETVSKVIGHWVRLHRVGRISLSEAWTAVCDHNAALIRPPWPEERLRREFDALVRLDLQSNGAHKPSPDGERNGQPDNATIGFSEDEIAHKLVNKYGKRLRFVPAWGRWYVWQGKRWAVDQRNTVLDLARRCCRADALRADDNRIAQRLSSEKTIRAVFKIVQTDPRITCRPEDWDCDPWLLNTPDGVIDLKAGEHLAADPDRLLSKMTYVSPADGCPTWLRFLDRITDGDRDVLDYLQRFAGYCLTGDTSEQMFLFLHGPGANGKSVFIAALTQVMGDYAATATLDTFMSTRANRHLSELAGLHAARLVAVPETEAGVAWSEARIKTVTGGEKIRANFMRQDHFEFQPRFKLVVAGNHRPRFNSSAEAMRRRLQALPLDIVIPPKERDPKLLSKLKAEAGGILAWMIKGCRAWQQHGLRPPAVVKETADAYLREEDLIGHWLKDCCEQCADSWEASKSLFQNWKTWAEDHGEAVGSGRALGEALRDRGFKAERQRQMRGWTGLRLIRNKAAGDQP